MTDPLAPRPNVRFGEFEFVPASRRLERGGEGVELSSRALDILAALIERPGEVIGKRELLERVWPDTSVVDAALRFHMVALRRALGDSDAAKKLIMTVPGRGYCFVGALESAPAAVEGGAAPLRDAPRPLPVRPAKVVGRDEAVEDVLLQLELQRFVTVVGPGGIGKTTVALLAAHQWEATHRGSTVFVDLGDLAPESPESVAEALCAMLGIVVQGTSALECVLVHLRTSQALVVLDTCEGVVDAAARLAEALVASAPGVGVLATSREALRAEGEVVYRIEPLPAPPPAVELTAEEALSYPAVQLFVQRAAANHSGRELDDQHAAIVSAICRELDGMALAIELAAGRVEALGVQQVANMLATEFALTWPGRRTAVPRQQTLNATLNWSHELLDPTESKVFRRLSVFAGTFSLEAAMAVCSDSQTHRAEVVEALSSLVAKSLVRTAMVSARKRYRMSDITRAYARIRLGASAEETEVRQRQACYYMDSLNPPAAGRQDQVETSEQVANVRAVLGWAFATEGMDAVAVELAAAAASLWLREGFLADSRRWTREALTRLDRGLEVGSELEARIALASSLVYIHGLTPESHRNWEIIYQRTQFDGRNDLRLGGLAVVWGRQISLAQFGAAQRLLDESDFLNAVSGDPTVAPAFHWMAATTAHFRGDHRAARMHATRILSELNDAAGDLMRRLFTYDLEVGALRLLSLSHFFLGDFDRALALRARARERATALGYVALLSNTLYWEAFVAYQFEQAEDVDRLTTSIIESEKPNAQHPTVGWAIALQGLSLVRRGELARGGEMVSRGLSTCEEIGSPIMDAFICAERDLQVVLKGGTQAAWSSLDEPDEESWISPEVLRIKGVIAESSDDLAGAEARYLDALATAERQGALIWRLRAATSLATLWVRQGRAAEAQAILSPVYAQFSTAQRWPDLRRAADCLEDCRRALTVVAGSPNAVLHEDHRVDSFLEQRGAPTAVDPPGAIDA
jgi:predicted ATPase/DNA-binding winged helix-turn-helix (wHTH) protein